MRLVAVFDIDGTLLDSVADHGYRSGPEVLAGTVAHAEACRRVTELLVRGWRVLFLTARAQHLAVATLQQLREHVHPDIKAADVRHQPHWTGYPAATQYKANALRGILQAAAAWNEDVQFYCGDHAMDMEAAQLAGVPFVTAAAWRHGASVQLQAVAR